MLQKALRNRLKIIKNDSEKQPKQTRNIVIKFCRTRNAQKSMFHEGVRM